MKKMQRYNSLDSIRSQFQLGARHYYAVAGYLSRILQNEELCCINLEMYRGNCYCEAGGPARPRILSPLIDNRTKDAATSYLRVGTNPYTLPTVCCRILNPNPAPSFGLLNTALSTTCMGIGQAPVHLPIHVPLRCSRNVYSLKMPYNFP